MAYKRKHSPFSAPTLLVGGPDLPGPIQTATVITNSGIMQVGDVVGVTTAASGNGVVCRRYAAAGDAILGICVGFGQADGQVPAKDSGQTPDRVTVESDNETDKKVYAIVDVTPGAVYSAPFISGQTIHTTQNFGAGTWLDPGATTDAGRLNETSASRTTSAGRGLVALGPDPDDTSRGLVMIAEGLVQSAID